MVVFHLIFQKGLKSIGPLKGHAEKKCVHIDRKEHKIKVQKTAGQGKKVQSESNRKHND